MFVVTKDGKRLQVDDSGLGESPFAPIVTTVGMFPDGVKLRKVWILDISKDVNFMNHTTEMVFETLCSRCFNHYPTEEEILYWMSAEGVDRNGYAFVEEAYVLDDEDV